ncbi:TrkH family potassium uptake protein [Micrococcales bacterium 31B]|nr:TrkH family potassium uptake protein [Micrococcales bacterium 31B]
MRGDVWLRAGRRIVKSLARSSPARLATLVFVAVIVVISALLCIPAAHAAGHDIRVVDAAFTAVSAVTVTGLTTVDTATAWSPLGLVIILVAIKVGGLGVLTLASMLGLTVSRRMGLTQRLITASETRAERLSEVRSVISTIVITSTLGELVTAIVLLPRLWMLGESFGEGAWHAIFYGVSAFNNAGFVPEVEGFAQYSGDPWVAVPIALSVFIGSLGFPVVLVLAKRWRTPQKWTLHTKITLATTSILVLMTVIGFGLMEWNNQATLGPRGVGEKINIIFFSAIMPRSGGFSLIDLAHAHEGTWLLLDAMMFVGGGSGSTAGGIKVTTLALLALAIIAEARGDRDVEVFNRRIPASTVRQAISVLFIGATMVFAATLALLEITGLSLDVVLFETLSAFATVGLSVGITPTLPESAKWVLIALMMLGRIGTMTLSAALALRDRRRVIRLPEESPIVG